MVPEQAPGQPMADAIPGSAFDARLLRVEPVPGMGQRLTLGLDAPLRWKPFQHLRLVTEACAWPLLFLSPPGETTHPELLLSPRPLTAPGVVEPPDAGLPPLPPAGAVRLRGPLGNGLDPERVRGRELLLIASGRGLATMLGCLCWAVASGEPRGRVTVLAGARSPDDLVFREALEDLARQDRIDLRMAVEEAGPGWSGARGVVPVLFRGLRLDPPATTAILAGPAAMLKFAVLELLMRGVHEHAILVVPESGLRCTPATCQACSAGHAYVCDDGPVFAWTQVRETPEAYF